MITRFFNRTVTIKKLSSGKVRRYSSTATVDGSIQEDTEAQEILQAEHGSMFRGFFEIGDAVKAGRKLVDDNGKEYMVEEVEQVNHPLTGASYLEATLRLETSKQGGSRNV